MKKLWPDGDGVTNSIGGDYNNIGAGCSDITAADPSWIDQTEP